MSRQLEKIKPTITTLELARAVHNAIMWRGLDFVYPKKPFNQYMDEPVPEPEIISTCVYTYDGSKTGSCLFGVAFIDVLGYKLDRHGSITSVLREMFDARMSDEEELWFARMQSAQDRSLSYSHVAAIFNEGVQRFNLDVAQIDLSGYAKKTVREKRLQTEELERLQRWIEKLELELSNLKSRVVENVDDMFNDI